MRPIHIDKQSVIDCLCLFVGSAVGAAASAAFLVHRFTREPGGPTLLHHWVRKPIQGAPDPATPGEPLK